MVEPAPQEPVGAALEPGHLAFRCNICGAAASVELQSLARETRSCSCGSTPRMRAMVHALSCELFGRSLAIRSFPAGKEMRGLGLSDCREYASVFEQHVDYLNTWYDEEPRLDITNVEADLHGSFDFVLASDVFEHVTPPVSAAFENARLLLRPGGVLVVSVPYGDEGPTVEHFPRLHEFELVERDGRRVLRNLTAEGTTEEFDELVFHGGTGFTVEMREFSRPSLESALREAGFGYVRFYDRPWFPAGIYWSNTWSWPVAARIGER